MNASVRVIVPLSLFIVSCSDKSQETSVGETVEQAYEMSRMDRDELCSSLRRVSKDAVKRFATLKAGERSLPSSTTESMSRLYREYQENETWFHIPGASDCHVSNRLDRPPGTIRWAHYKCRWNYPTLDQARSAFRDLNRYIEICMKAEDIEVRQDKDGEKVSRRMFRAPNSSLNLYTLYFTESLQDGLTGQPVLEIDFQAGMSRQ